MGYKYVLLVFILSLCQGEKEDKWVWGENNRNSNSRSFSTNQDPNSRYNIFEETDDYRPAQYYPNRPVNQRPTPIYENRPPASGVGFIPEQRPGGVYGGRPVGSTYGIAGNQYLAEQSNSGVLVGPVPSWLKEGPIKNFDKCKCAEKFNCNSPGISYGHCDVGKQYCCYSTKKDLGGPIPSKPVHSIENGILVGPGGPVDPIPGGNNYQRPPKQLGTGYYRPGGYHEPNEYSAANGVLVGPGGPYDTSPYGLGRTANSGVKAK